MIGRIISILAPVVPIQLERMVPRAKSPTLILGGPARHGDISRHTEQAKQQDDKRQIIIDHTLQHRLRCMGYTVHQREGHHKKQGPEGHSMGLVLLPPVGLYKRQYGNT